MKNITAHDFENILLQEANLSSLEVTGDVDIAIASNTSKTLENILINSLTLKSDNKPVNLIHLSNCTIHSLFLDSLSVKYFLLDSCQINFIIFHSGHTNQFRIANTKSNASSEYQSIIITDGVTLLQNLFIANVVISKIYLGSKIKSAKIENCSIKNIEGANVLDELLLSNVIGGELFNFESDSSIKTFNVKKCTAAKIVIKGYTVNQLNIYAGFIDEIELKPKACDEVTIRGVSFFDETFGDQHPSHRIGKISLSNWINIKNTTFLFAYLELSEFNAHEINHLNNALFDTITITDQFTIMDSTLIKCRFHKVRLRHCNIHLFDTFLQDCEFVNVKWPERHQINEAVDSYKQYESIREVYRQLKKVSLAQHDKIGALEFQTNEMRRHCLIKCVSGNV